MTRSRDYLTVAVYVCFAGLFAVLFALSGLVYGKQVEQEQAAAKELRRSLQKEKKTSWIAKHAPGAKETCQYVIRIGEALECTVSHDRWPFPRQLVCYEEKCMLGCQ